jgi:hypothetical protein
LKIHVIPKQAYVFVDGKAIRDGGQTIALSGGSHTVSVDNYAAATFKKNEQYDQQNKLMVVGHADIRGPKKYNQALSARRAAAAKEYLVSQGVPADKIETTADGQEHQLTEQQVMNLQSQDSQPG